MTTVPRIPGAEGNETFEIAVSLLRVKNILVPVDFSTPSQKALSHALGLAAQFGSTVHLVHVIEPVHPYPVNGLTYFPGDLPPDSLYDTRSDAEKALKRLRDSARIAVKEVPVEASLRVGRAYHEIVRTAQDFEADLIVIATHGYTGLKHVLLGSTAERVVRHAPCPVLVLRSRDESQPAD